MGFNDNKSENITSESEKITNESEKNH